MDRQVDTENQPPHQDTGPQHQVTGLQQGSLGADLQTSDLEMLGMIWGRSITVIAGNPDQRTGSLTQQEVSQLIHQLLHWWKILWSFCSSGGNQNWQTRTEYRKQWPVQLTSGHITRPCSGQIDIELRIREYYTWMTKILGYMTMTITMTMTIMMTKENLWHKSE